MSKNGVYIAFAILVLAIIISNIKISKNIEKIDINSRNIVRYGEEVEKDDIINIDDRKEIVIKVFEDGSYLTKKIN